VVITVNSSTRFKPQDQFVYRQSDDTIHWIIGGIEPPALAAAREEEEFREARQRERLWYVATTRARDLLVIPDLPGAPSRSWSRVMDLGQKLLPEIPTNLLPEPSLHTPQIDTNSQTDMVFADERARLDAASPPIVWDRPSERDADRSADIVDTFVVDAASDGPQRILGAGALRGTILHKIMEEVLIGELRPIQAEVTARATELLMQLQATANGDSDAGGPDATEMAETALRTYALPELAPFLEHLEPEIPLWAANPPHFLVGRADAAAVQDNRIVLVIDWKSDVNPSAAAHSGHTAQLRDYLRVTRAERGAVVYMSSGQVIWVTPA
jgi:ATP-dependent exoDNAse (exonuclease V) beta subunit